MATVIFLYFYQGGTDTRLQHNPLYASSIDTLLSKHPQFNNKAYSDQCFNKLLQTTITYLSSSIPSHRHRHNILSLRRYVMIIHHKVSSVNHTLYNELLTIFKAHHTKHQDTTQNIFYLIHVSKAAGSTICKTASKHAKRKSTKQNCNLPQMGTPIKTPRYTARTCAQIDTFVHDNHLQFIAQESPMSGHQQDIKPTLCTEYRYILSIRKP
eukprot:1105541_1